jgi:Alpha/beta hydrolase domain
VPTAVRSHRTFRRCFAELLLALAVAIPHAQARVERLEVLEREDFAAKTPFGMSGAYEKLRGRAWFALDPEAPANAEIADLGLAPRDGRGLVTFSTDFLVLRPVDASRGNTTLLYEVNNRGGIGMLAQLDDAPANNNPANLVDAGNGFLFRQGFTLIWSGWASDVAARPGDNRLVLAPPVATDHGKPITGRVAYEVIVTAPTETARFAGLLGTVYRPAVDGAPDAVLSEREQPEGERTTIDRVRWSFVAAPGGGWPTELHLRDGFKPGRIYELVYTARDPMVVALGMAGIRDLLSHLRSHPLADAPPPRHSIIFGISQSGRLIQTMLLHALHVDEAGAQVFDGAFVHVAGGGKGGFDYRFAMPTRHFSMLEDHIYPTDYFPFTTMPERDPVTGREASVLDRARQFRAVPKLFYVNNSSEYWNRSASLIGTDPEGQHDLAPAPEARIYLIAGAQHYVTKQRDRGIFSNCVNPLNHYRVLRALVLALHRWVGDVDEPPPNRYPRIGDGELVSVAAYKAAFPNIPGFLLPATNLRPPRLDLGPRFSTERIAGIVPPPSGRPFETLVPTPSADGLDQGGIALPEILVPLGTYTGFNTRTEAAGFPWATGRWDGSFVPFPRTEAERRLFADPRSSLEARYTNRTDYESKLRAAAAGVVRDGFLREDEVTALVGEAGGFYDRIMAHDPRDRSCNYLFGR